MEKKINFKIIKIQLLTLVSGIILAHFNAIKVYASDSIQTLDGANEIVTSNQGYGFNVDLSGDYLFEFDKDTLSIKAKKALNNILKLYKQYEGFNIQINGHTDSKGSQEYNQDLSERRAQRVYSWFTKNGIPSSSLSMTGYGETQPTAENQINGQDNPQGRAINRRVEIETKTRLKVKKLPTAVPPRYNIPSKPIPPKVIAPPKPKIPNYVGPPKTVAPPKPKTPNYVAPPKPVKPPKPIAAPKPIAPKSATQIKTQSSETDPVAPNKH